MVHADAFSASCVTNGRARWITLTGELDVATAPALSAELDRAMTCPTHAVVLDLSGLTFMDCSAVRAVIDFADQTRARGWELRIVSPPPQIAKIFTLTDSEERLGLRTRPDDRRLRLTPSPLRVAW
jgi:anti-sigma B factor antagonist